MLVLGYVAFTFVGFVRVAWPAESGRPMNRDDHDYDNEGWRLSPDGTALSGSISTILTVLRWVCVGTPMCGALTTPVCA